VAETTPPLVGEAGRTSSRSRRGDACLQ
jgi:hypothetical protein